jgi:hypothetical protein
MSIKSVNYGSKPLPPGLENSALNSYGHIANIPKLGTDWELEADIWSYYTTAAGYLLAISGDTNPEWGGQVAIVTNYRAPQSVEFYSWRAKPEVPAQIIRDYFFTNGGGKKNRRNKYRIVCIGGVISLFLNGIFVRSIAYPYNVEWVGAGLQLGSVANASFSKGHFTLLKLKINNQLLIDIDFENDGVNKVTPGLYDLQKIAGATIYPIWQPPAPKNLAVNQTTREAIWLNGKTLEEGNATQYEYEFIADSGQDGSGTVSSTFSPTF